MKRLLATTAIAAAFALPTAAEQHDMNAVAQMESMGIKATDLIDMRVYMATGDTEINAMAEMTDVPDDWQMVGDIDDLLISEDGEVKAVLVDAGGFLGMGETERRVDMVNLRFVTDSDDEGEFFVVFNGDRSKFEEQMQYDEAEAQSDGTMRASEDDEMASEIEASPERQAETVDWASVTTEDLLGAPVYGSNDEWIGDLSELNLADDGSVAGVIIDVGGFLGIGEKPVELAINEVDIRRYGRGDDLRAYVAATEEELESMEAWSPDQ